MPATHFLETQELSEVPIAKGWPTGVVDQWRRPLRQWPRPRRIRWPDAVRIFLPHAPAWTLSVRESGGEGRERRRAWIEECEAVPAMAPLVSAPDPVPSVLVPGLTDARRGALLVVEARIAVAMDRLHAARHEEDEEQPGEAAGPPRVTPARWGLVATGSADAGARPSCGAPLAEAEEAHLVLADLEPSRATDIAGQPGQDRVGEPAAVQVLDPAAALADQMMVVPSELLAELVSTAATRGVRGSH
jgi:hypothetical protein